MKAPTTSKQNTENKTKQKLNKLIDFIDNEYVDNVNTDSIVDQTVNGILEKLDPGNFEVTLAELNNGSTNIAHTGSNVKLKTSNPIHYQIIDDSSLTSGTIGEGGLIYNLVSGSIDEGTTTDLTSAL